MRNIGHSQGTRRLLVRAGLAFLNAVLTGLFAFVFAYLWTDEAVDGSPYAIADPVGAAVDGALAGIVPILFGLALCGVMLWGTRVAWWWPAILVTGTGGIGAVLGASVRFAEGMPGPTAVLFAPVALAGATGLVGSTRARLRQVGAEP